ncbi:hypothetical protein PTKIN_Ptkin04bG0235900 [Pterospermum kingtungense]
MAESAVRYVLEKLAVFIEKEMQQLRGGHEDVANVRGELERVKAFLRVADGLEDTDEEVKVWVKQIRDVAHDMEDILDEYMLLLPHNHGDQGVSAFLHKMSCCVRNMKARCRVASNIHGINSRIRGIREGYRRLRQKFCPDEGSSSNGVGNAWQDGRGDALLLDETDVVGIDESKKKLVKWLVDGGDGRKVISLSGMGGLGKTTLAKQVYEDAEVKKHFPVHAWITVSQSKLEVLLKDMVQQLSRVISIPVPEGVDSMSSYQLKTIIKTWLRKRRYLIILDDVWRVNEWDAIKFALPANEWGSRVMLTTRNADLALSSRIESEGEVYNLEPLPPEESWKLFCRKTFRGNHCPSYLEEICKQILKKCEGLPLAIVAISGVLATKDKRRIDEWEMVGRSLGAEIDGNDKLINLKKVLSLSINDLPYYLKSCFLYLSIFPEDYPIELMKLIRLWTAEGFVEVKQGKTQEEVAEGYFTELLNRSLIQVAGTTSVGKVKSCRIHDLLREIIILKSREQNFTVIAKEQNGTWPDKVRRLSIHNTLQNVQQNRFASHLRSLFMFGVEENPRLHKLFPGGFRLLAVLELQATPITKFPVDVVNLYYLKYLSLRETKVTVVPRFIGKLQNLETLDLKHSYVTELPVEILQLQRLRHLLLYRYEFESYDHFHTKHGFKGLEKIGMLQSLQKLCLIEVDKGDVILAELGKLTQLRRLCIKKLRKEDGKKLCWSIEKLTCLRALSIISIEEDEIIDVHHLNSPPPLLQRLYLRGRLETMPYWIPYLHSLVKVYLKWSRLLEDPLVSLQNLPNLLHLELVQVYDGADTLCFKAEGFRKLKRLGLDNFDELKWVQIQVGAMPSLEKLSIQRCKSMEKVPLGIEHLTKLNVLEFFDMPHELIRSLRQDEHGEDYWRVAHIPEVYSTYWRHGAWEVYSLESFVEGESTPRPNTVISSQDLHTRWK